MKCHDEMLELSSKDVKAIMRQGFYRLLWKHLRQMKNRKHQQRNKKSQWRNVKINLMENWEVENRAVKITNLVGESSLRTEDTKERRSEPEHGTIETA